MLPTQKKDVNWMAVIYEMLSSENEKNRVGLPTFGIKKLGRTVVSKYKHDYTEGGTLGYIFCNALYISPKPTENQLVYFVMLIAHDLCQCLAMRKKTDKKILAHGKEVKQLLEKVGLIFCDFYFSPYWYMDGFGLKHRGLVLPCIIHGF